MDHFHFWPTPSQKKNIQQTISNANLPLQKSHSRPVADFGEILNLGMLWKHCTLPEYILQFIHWSKLTNYSYSQISAHTATTLDCGGTASKYEKKVVKVRCMWPTLTISAPGTVGWCSHHRCSFVVLKHNKSKMRANTTAKRWNINKDNHSQKKQKKQNHASGGFFLGKPFPWGEKKRTEGVQIVFGPISRPRRS